MNSNATTAPRFSGLEFSAGRISVWGRRSALSILDQALVSGAGFLLNFLLARWLSGEAYGSFTVAFAIGLFLSGLHNVLLLEPMSVMGPAHYSNQTSTYFAAQWKIHQCIGIALATGLFVVAIIIRLLNSHQLAAAVTASACAFPFFLMLWLVRRMAYMVRQPLIAVWASGCYFFSILLGLLLLHRFNVLSPSSTFLTMGISGFLSASVPLRQLKTVRTSGERCPLRVVAHENWNYGRWLVLSTGLFSVTSQIQTYLVAGMLGLSAAGALRAMQVPSVLMTQIVTAIGLLILPSMSYEFGVEEFGRLRGKAKLASAFLTLTAMCYAVVLWVLSAKIEHVLYAGKYSRYAHLIPILGLVPVFTGLATGVSMAQRASQKPHFDLMANAISAPIGMITAVFFVRWWGLTGAAFSLVAGFAVYASVFCWSFKNLGPGRASHRFLS